MKQISPMQAMLTIVERGKGIEWIRKYEEYKIIHHVQIAGHGTAASQLLDTLGFGTPERDIIMSFGPKDTCNQIMYYLKDEDRPSLGAPGIAATMNLSGMTALWAAGLSQLEELEPERGEVLMEQGNHHSLIIVTVNQGYTDAVMDTARAAGARGGTVVRARWAGTGASQKFAGISIQTEKEVLYIVAANRDREKIMCEINRLHGLKSAAQAMVISVPIEQMARLD